MRKVEKILKEAKEKKVDIEIFYSDKKISSVEALHTDSCHSIDVVLDDLFDDMILDFKIVSVDDYNKTIFANCGEDQKEDVLVVLVKLGTYKNKVFYWSCYFSGGEYFFDRDAKEFVNSETKDVSVLGYMDFDLAMEYKKNIQKIVDNEEFCCDGEICKLRQVETYYDLVVDGVLPIASELTDFFSVNR